MAAFLAQTLAKFLIVASLLPLNSCRYNRKYLAQGSRLVQYVTTANFSAANLPDEPHLEFRQCQFPHFGPDMFRALNTSTKRISFRKGQVRDVLIDATAPIEVLQIIDTGLVSLNAESGEPNVHLKQLTVRSKSFSEWSRSLALLWMLEEIDIAYCNMSYLDVLWFAGFGNLRVLDVSKNRLAVLDMEKGTLWSLERLHLWGNRLEKLHRFPEAFPKLQRVSLAQNRWRCHWVSKARSALVPGGVQLMDMDSVCRPGWESNGGLCCRRREHAEESDSKWQLTSSSSTQMMNKLKGLNGTVIGIEVGNTAVYLDQPLPL